MKNIYLVGFMGTGKSVVAKALAAKLKMRFLDLDSLIETNEGRKIKDIFAKDGEAYFRHLEKQAVQEVSKEDSLVIACGGGVVLDSDNIKMMKSSGRVVCLTSRPEIILQRCRSNTGRPLLNVKDPESEIRKLLASRQPFYSQAEISIDTSDRTIEEVAQEIINKVISND